MTQQSQPPDEQWLDDEEETGSLFESLLLLGQQWNTLLFGPLAIGALAVATSYLIQPTFTSKTTFLPPQNNDSAASAALSSLGAITSLAGAAGGLSSPAERYVSIMKGTTVADRLIDRFDLIKVYDSEYRFEARRELAESSRISLGKKDGLITVEVDDHDPKRAAEMANQYVHELRSVTATLALSEAQRRRSFFETQLQRTQQRLTDAQQAMQAAGLSAGALKAEPRAAAEQYAKLKAEVMASQVRLQGMRSYLNDQTSEIQRELALLRTLSRQLEEAGREQIVPEGPDYITKYREFKYEETLFELFAKQYELARVDESREQATIQVIDTALPAEYKSKPRRAMIGILTWGLSLVGIAAFILGQASWRAAFENHRLQRLGRSQGQKSI